MMHAKIISVKFLTEILQRLLDDTDVKKVLILADFCHGTILVESFQDDICKNFEIHLSDVFFCSYIMYAVRGNIRI